MYMQRRWDVHVGKTPSIPVEIPSIPVRKSSLFCGAKSVFEAARRGVRLKNSKSLLSQNGRKCVHACLRKTWGASLAWLSRSPGLSAHILGGSNPIPAGKEIGLFARKHSCFFADSGEKCLYSSIFYPPPPYIFCRHCLILQPGCIVNAAHTCAMIALCASENAPPFGILPAPALRPPRWRECGKGEWRGGAGSVCKRKGNNNTIK